MAFHQDTLRDHARHLRTTIIKRLRLPKVYVLDRPIILWKVVNPSQVSP
jgi:hypothetical protein